MIVSNLLDLEKLYKEMTLVAEKNVVNRDQIKSELKNLDFSKEIPFFDKFSRKINFQNEKLKIIYTINQGEFDYVVQLVIINEDNKNLDNNLLSPIINQFLIENNEIIQINSPENIKILFQRIS